VDILTNQTVINPQVHGPVELGRGSAASKPLNFYFHKSKAKRGLKVVVSAVVEEWLLGTLDLMGMPPPTAQEALALENVDARWWKRKEAGLVLGAGSSLGSASSGFSLSQFSPKAGSPGGRAPSILSLEVSAPKTPIQYKRKCKDTRKLKLVVVKASMMMWAFSCESFSSRARPLIFWQIVVILSHLTSLLRCLRFLMRVVSSLSHFWSGGVWVQGARG
jgi:hypothetical protein